MTGRDTTLDGPWLATVADDDLRRTFADDEVDTASWHPIDVPGHWRRSDAFADSDGPLLHRTMFDAGALPTGPDGAGPAMDDRRTFLRFDGLFYQGDVWLDGTYLGDTEGYFAPHTFEITEAVRARSEHVLAVELACAHPSDRSNKRNITGVFQHWDCFDPEWNPGGIWRPVRLQCSGPVRIAALDARCTEATEERAVLALRATLDAVDAVEATVTTTVGTIDHATTQTLATGPNTVEWTVTVDRPRLWWPHALGPAELYDVVVEVAVGELAVSDRRSFRTGLRALSWRKSVLSVNGERLFLKGTNQGPTRMAIADATGDECRRDIELARETGLDLVRLHAHVARPETYAAADEAGMLLWQDFPLQWGYARQIRKQAVRQARQMVELLAHHPAIAVWCGHNEPLRLDLDPTAFLESGRTTQLGIKYLAGQQLPTWNKSVLDGAVRRAIERADGTRLALANSGVLPHLPRLRTTDSHLYLGWYMGDERDLPTLARTVPNQVRFPTEFGAQAVPESDDFVDRDAWPDLDWEALARRHAMQPSILRERVPTAGHTYASWKRATQQYQATVVRRHVEELRRLKYRPTGGFAQFCFADGHPAVTWSVLDHNRRPKLAHEALADACRPVIVVADRLSGTVAAGDAVALDVHVVSDRRLDLSGRITAELRWAGGGHRWQFEGSIPADSCVRVGTIQFEVPAADGELSLDLRGQVGDDTPTNRYTATIV